MTTIMGLVLLGAVTGLVVTGGTFSGGVVGVVCGALAAWVSRLACRVDSLEQGVATIAREARAAQIATPRVQSAAARSHAERPEAASPTTPASDAAAPAAPRPAQRPTTQRHTAAAERDAVDPRRAAATKPSAAQRSAAEPDGVKPRGAEPARRARGFEHEASLADRAVNHVVSWFTTGNVPVKVGVVLSLFGVGFLVKEGVDRHWLVLPVEIRLAFVAAFGAALLALGWRLRETRRSYALSVQGGGIAILYLTSYSSFALFHVIPASAAFAILLVVTAAAGSLAVLQDARALAVLGIVGGFLAPVLVSTGAGNHVALFGYYAILNLAVLGIAWFKAWRELNVLGFAFTFGIGAFWGYNAYTPAHFATTEPFLILFALMYIAIPVLFATRVRPELRGFVDSTLVFGTPVVGFGLQSLLVGDIEHGLAISAVALAAVYAASATVMFKRGVSELKVLAGAHAALALTFLTVAVPLALDARWTSVAWALQGAGMVAVGQRQRRRLPVAAGLALQLVSGIAYCLSPLSGAARPVLNGPLLGAVVIALAGAFCARSFEPATSDDDGARARGAFASSTGALMLLVWASAWWLYAGVHEIQHFVPSPFAPASTLLFLSATTLLALAAAERFVWPRIVHLGLVLWLGALGAALSTFPTVSHPAQSLGWLAWTATFATMGCFLYAREQIYGSLRGALHAVAYWLATAVVAWETHWQVARVAGGIWPDAAALAIGAAIALITVRMLDRVEWPLAANRNVYLHGCCGGVLAALTLPTVALNALSPGDAAPLPYIPLLNPLELASLLVCVLWLRWLAELERSVPSLGIAARHRATLAALFGWSVLTMTVARAVHHWAGVPFTLERLAASTDFQAALSIAWGTTGLAAMVSGTRYERRSVWLAGATLMGLVVVKLFLVDLGNTGTLERIVSFLGVGILLLVVGYLAPVPPRDRPDVLGRPDGI
jgi:uncharacterized membrane protein